MGRGAVVAVVLVAGLEPVDDVDSVVGLLCFRFLFLNMGYRVHTRGLTQVGFIYIQKGKIYVKRGRNTQKKCRILYGAKIQWTSIGRDENSS